MFNFGGMEGMKAMAYMVRVSGMSIMDCRGVSMRSTVPLGLQEKDDSVETRKDCGIVSTRTERLEIAHLSSDMRCSVI